MLPMFVRGKGGSRLACARRAPGAGLLVLATPLLAALLLTSCAGTDDDGTAHAAATMAATTTVAPTTSTSTTTTLPPTTSTSTTTAPTTTSTTTSTTTTTTSTTSTTTPASTTTTTPARQATQPIAPPADTYASEPVIELGRIVIPKIGVDMALFEGIRMSTLDLGPGHWPGTAMPGELGNVVIGGHRTSKHRVFRNIDDLGAGDQLIFQGANGEQVYIVNRVEVVNPTDVWIINPTDTPTATLFACHPPGSTRQRIVVFADLQV
jgi:sortase A